MVTTPLFRLEPGWEYKILSGSVGGTSFIFVDGRLIMEFLDQVPLHPEQALRVGFGLYQSNIRISGLQVYKQQWRQTINQGA